MSTPIGLPKVLKHVPYMQTSKLIVECIKRCRPGGLYLEFGVSSGHSIRFLRGAIPLSDTIYGFDSFKGLPEAWNNIPAGGFASKTRVQLKNVVLVEGMFADTLPAFVRQHAGQHVSYMNVDCDLYSSTKTVLTELRDAIQPGTTITFDEYYGYVGWEEHEYKAFAEFITDTGRRFEYVGQDGRYRAAVRITE